MQIEGRVGPSITQDGANTPPRMARLGSSVTTDGHGRYYESTYRGSVYSASTAAAGVAPGTVLSTAPPMALWNPNGSGKVLVVNSTFIGYVSGTIGAGTVAYGFVIGQVTKPTTGTVLTPQCTLLNGTAGVGQAFQGSTLVAVPTMLLPVFTLQPTLATAPAAGGFAPAVIVRDDVAGSIIVPPGSVFCMQAIAAAGTTPLVLFGISWEEVPL